MSKFCMSCMEQYEDEFEVCPYCGYVEETKEEDALHMVPGSILHERYIVGKSIGFGGFGVTYIGYDALLEHKVAIKEYMPSEFSTRAMGEAEITIFSDKKEEQFHEGLQKFHEEAKRLAKFNRDDGIVKVYDTFEENNTAYIIMELLEGETLASYLEHEKTVPVEKAISIILPIAESLKAVHEAGVIHRDISPDNIFLTKDGKVKLIDFGAARFATTSHSRSLSVLIKPGYSPEEQYRSRGDQGPYTDIYALGAVLYRMITGVVAPDSLERRAYLENKKKDILVPISKYCKDISEDRQNAILNAMNVRIEDRTQSAEEFIHELTTNDPVPRKKGKIKAVDYFSWPLWAKISIPTVAVMVITLGILFAMGIIGFRNDIQKNIYVPDGMSRVPSIINTEMEQAETRLKQAVLLYSISGKEYSSLIPANMILTQSVDGGAVVAENTIIDLVISGGAQMAAVPNVEGMYVGEAIAALEALGFEVQTETEYSSTVAEGGVITQSVKAEEEYPVGETIILTVSLGRDPEETFEEVEVTVPDFIGKTYEEAQNLAAEAGLMVIAKEKAYSADYAKDVIMQQGTDAGTMIMSGSTIELTISLGIQVIKTPDVQFMAEAEAVALLEMSGLKASVSHETSETVKAGLVITQNPAYGTELQPGDTVAITVSKGAASFAMPNVIGMSESEAKSVLTAKGISVTVNYEYSTSDDVGKVLEQSVKADTQVYAGSAITITVSTGEELFEVPNVEGKTKTEAETILKSAGFVPKVNEIYNETVAAGTVISQAPGAASSQPSGTQILITVSLGKKPITVPDVTGKTQSVAVSTLESYGFVVKVQEQYHDTVAAGKVISHTPEAKATAYNGDTITIVVSKGKENIPPTSLLISPSATSVDVGGTVTITSVISPSNATDKTVTYKSSNTSVAKVSSAGVVTAVAPGTVTITATTNTGGLTASCKITVKEPTIELNYYRVESAAGLPVDLIATPSISGAAVTWSSTNTSVATVDSNGRVGGVSAGSCEIRASITVGGKTYYESCKFEVAIVGITFEQHEITLFVGETYVLNSTIVPLYTKAYDKNGNLMVNYEGWFDPESFSYDTSVVTFDGTTITAVSEGETSVQTETADHVGNFYGDTCKVIVKEKPTLTLSHDNVTVHVGDSLTVHAFSNMSLVDGKVVFNLSNHNIVFIANFFDREACLAEFNTPGTTVLTATMTVDGVTYTDSCTITVIEAGAVHVQIGTVYGRPGETVEVPVYLINNAGINAFAFGVWGNEKYPQQWNTDSSTVLMAIVGATNYDRSFSWLNGANTRTYTGTGKLGTLIIEIPDDGEIGDVFTLDYAVESLEGNSHFWNDTTNGTKHVDLNQVTWTNGAIIITE